MNDFLKLMLCFIISFLLCSFFCKGYIYFSKKREVQQYIRKDIVETHQKKKGTPTMGGLIFIIIQVCKETIILVMISNTKVIRIPLN